MKYTIVFKPRATKDLRAINTNNAKKFLLKVRAMEKEWLENAEDLLELRASQKEEAFLTDN